MANKKINENLELKFDAIRYCIINGYDEDLQEHLFDLLRGLHYKNFPDEELTAEGLKLKSYFISE